MLLEDGHYGDKLRSLLLLLSLEVLKGVSIIYSITVNLNLVVSWIWLPNSGFFLEVLKGFSLYKQILCCGCVCSFCFHYPSFVFVEMT
jgi:hypothetical protein